MLNPQLINRIATSISLVLYFVTLNAQGFELKMGVGWRITPIYSNPIGAGVSHILIDDHRHLTGSNLNFDLGYYFTKLKLTTSIVSSFRYDLVSFERPDGRFSPSRKDFISDYVIQIDKHILTRDRSSLIVGIGFGFMNNGTEFGLKSLAGVVNGSPIYSISLLDLSYSSNIFSVGYQKIPWSIRIHAISTRGNEYFNEKGAFILPELSIKRKIF